MWQLDLLSWVIPAFGALAQDFIDCENPDAYLFQDAIECYSDIVSIGAALSVSGGEWASGLREEKVSRLLMALESRLPKRRTPFSFIVCLVILTSAHHYFEADCSLGAFCGAKRTAGTAGAISKAR